MAGSKLKNFGPLAISVDAIASGHLEIPCRLNANDIHIGIVVFKNSITR
ncbi:MAG: hypothetical protein MUC48_20460 [Leptolyngbya sp. Prado105]|nr:hypothetical protein [Leptolyngbya sp. Prado105]